MTLILKLDLGMVKVYLHTKIEVSRARGSKVIAWTDRNTDRQTDRQTDKTENITYPHTRVVKIQGQERFLQEITCRTVTEFKSVEFIFAENIQALIVWIFAYV